MFTNLNIADQSLMYTSHSENLFYDSKYFFFVGNRLIDNRSYLTAAHLQFPVAINIISAFHYIYLTIKYNIMHITYNNHVSHNFKVNFVSSDQM